MVLLLLPAFFVIAVLCIPLWAIAADHSPHFALEYTYHPCPEPPNEGYSRDGTLKLARQVVATQATVNDADRADAFRFPLSFAQDPFAVFNQKVPSVSMPTPNAEYFTQYLFTENFYLAFEAHDEKGADGQISRSNIVVRSSFETLQTWLSHKVQSRLKHFVTDGLKRYNYCFLPMLTPGIVRVNGFDAQKTGYQGFTSFGAEQAFLSDTITQKFPAALMGDISAQLLLPIKQQGTISMQILSEDATSEKTKLILAHVDERIRHWNANAPMMRCEDRLK